MIASASIETVTSNRVRLRGAFFGVPTILAWVTRHADLIFVVLAWIFVIFRYLQAYVHVTKMKELADERGWKTTQNVAAGLAGFVVPVIWFGMDWKGAADKDAAALQARQEYLTTLATQRCQPGYRRRHGDPMGHRRLMHRRSRLIRPRHHPGSDSAQNYLASLEAKAPPVSARCRWKAPPTGSGTHAAVIGAPRVENVLGS